MGRGSAGGRGTLSRHGREHFAEIGRRGFAATVARHFGGSKEEYMKALHNRAWEKVTAGFVDRLIAQGDCTISHDPVSTFSI